MNYMMKQRATKSNRKKKERIYNLSIKQIINNASKVYIDIINEITISIDNKEFNIEQVIKIFTLKDRLIYVGILIVVLSLFLDSFLYQINIYIYMALALVAGEIFITYLVKQLCYKVQLKWLRIFILHYIVVLF